MYKLMLLLTLMGCTHPLLAQRKTPRELATETFHMHKGGGDQDLYYESNYRLNRLDTGIKTLLIYIHGLHRNALNYFDYADRGVRSAGKQKTTLLITPQYVNEEDQISNSDLCWHKAEWKDGYGSISANRKRQMVSMSSYEVLDSLIMSVLRSGMFPGIKKIVVAGHSAGGQFVQRYSATTPLPDLLNNYSFRFIVMNPSSYLYPDVNRPLPDGSFGIPDTAACPLYNVYPKGLTGLNKYAQAAGAQSILTNILQRDIVILLGSEDTHADDPDLDITCQANVQGTVRLQRGLYFLAHLQSYPAYSHKMNYTVVRGEGHEGDMIASPEALSWIYGEGPSGQKGP